MKNLTNPQLELAFDFVRYTNQNIFLTGKAGSGKTTFLHNLKHQSPKRMVVVAPTGVAAINAGGLTIHSFFQMSFGPQLPQTNQSLSINNPSAFNIPTAFKRFSKEKINIIRSLDLLVIDEISMVRADMLDGIDEVLRRFRDKRKSFGGVQLLMIGDLQQLAPIVKDDEWNILKKYYDTFYFFSSCALRQSGFISIELKHIYRQSDENFIKLLNQIRENKLDASTLQELNKRYRPNFIPKDDEGYIILTTHNNQAQEINHSKLHKLKTKSFFFQAFVDGEFPEYIYPTEVELELKTGVQVMFVKNDSSFEKRYYNGKIGTVVNIEEDGIEVQCKDEDNSIFVQREEWKNAKYALNKESGEIEENVIGTFEQYPLKLAWAITIHKSQGLTFEKAIINARLSFAHGQVYVALSRCKSLEGLVLSAPIEMKSVKNDPTVVFFTNQVEQNQPGEKELTVSRKIYQLELLADLFNFNTILWQIKYLLKLCNEHGSLLLGDLNNQLQAIVQPMNSEIIAVSTTFDRQIKQLISLSVNTDQNERLQERIKKACHYFIEKLELILIQPLQSTAFETDNKTVRKSFKDGFENLNRQINIKKSGLENCKNGFELKNYLNARAKASIDLSTIKSVSFGNAAFAKHPDFFKKMHSWRVSMAEELNVEISRILPQKTLLGIVEKLPANVADLKAVKGMGGKKLKQFGKEILKMLIAYRREKGMPVPENADKEAEMAMLDSKQISFLLFKEGKLIPEIAIERKMAITTIEGHLAHFVGTNEIPIDTLVDPLKKTVIITYFEKSKSISLLEAKAKLGDEYTYAEIRFVLKYLESQRVNLS
jgi:hypothetical protein